MKPPRIETERLVLTWPTPQQIDGYYAAIIGTELFDTLLWDGPTSDQEMHDYWILRRAEGHDPEKAFSVSIIVKASDACIGGASLRPVDGDPAILDVGYALAPAFHGQGYGTEAVGALVHEGFVNRGAERIFATVFVGNTASARVAEKIGMRLEGTLRRAVLKRGVWRDEWLYAITRPDWEHQPV